MPATSAFRCCTGRGLATNLLLIITVSSKLNFIERRIAHFFEGCASQYLIRADTTITFPFNFHDCGGLRALLIIDKVTASHLFTIGQVSINGLNAHLCLQPSHHRYTCRMSLPTGRAYFNAINLSKSHRHNRAGSSLRRFRSFDDSRRWAQGVNDCTELSGFDVDTPQYHY